MILPKKIFPSTIRALRWLTPTVFRLDVQPDSGFVFDFKPGQFVMLRLFNPDGTFWKQKAFSICSTPLTREYFELGIKMYGVFTRRAARLMPGDRVEIAGPYGVFTLDDTSAPAVLLAGGIGITPFLSMLRTAAMTHTAKQLFLLYANKTQDEVAYADELQAFSLQPAIRIVHLLSRGTADFPHETGHVQEALLLKHYGPFTGKKFYLCGPPGFMETAKLILLHHGVPLTDIKLERF